MVRAAMAAPDRDRPFRRNPLESLLSAETLGNMTTLVFRVVWLVSWPRGRRAADDNATLVESTVDVFLPRLAAELGLAEPGNPVDAETGARITRIARKGA